MNCKRLLVSNEKRRATREPQSRAVRRKPTESGDSLGDQRTFPGSLESCRFRDRDLLAAISSVSRHFLLQSGTYLSVLKTGREKRPTRYLSPKASDIIHERIAAIV